MKTTFKSCWLFMIISGLSLFQTACKKDGDQTPVPAPQSKIWNVKAGFNVDGVPLLFDTILHQNAAGQQYSVNKLHFYLSGFEFMKSNGTKTFSDTVIYLEAQSGKPCNFQIKELEYGNYTTTSFLIGLDSTHNQTDSLANTVENLNMAWPEMMGGGYHFMKLEGNFISGGTSYGYAMHLGKNQNLVKINLARSVVVNSSTDTLFLNMNINEWFKNPAIYDFNIDGNYSMGSDAAMLKLSTNGTDVFNE